jgi:hypothetical protein
MAGVAVHRAAHRRSAGMNPDPAEGVIIESEDECFVVCGGNPPPCDIKYMASRIVAENEGAIEWLQRQKQLYEMLAEAAANTARL